jgi:hypothetical protein
MKWIKKKEKFAGIARQTQKLKKRGKKMNGVRDKLANLYMHTYFFYEEHTEMYKKQPQDNNFDLLNQQHVSTYFIYLLKYLNDINTL